MKHVASRGGRTKSALWTILGILAELMLTAAAICALYIAWQMWWTGVQSEHNQIETRQSVSWSDPGKSGNVTVAKAQQGDPPVQPQSATEGELIAQIYIPRFGSQWQRNLVEGTDLTQLNKHGLGHYTDSQMPGQIGNFAFAGHRNGYGQPLGDVDKLQEGDPIIVRTQDYWYVYHYTSYKIVLPTQTEVVAANPENPGAAPTKRMLTMTTCEPKYSTPTHRWISYAEFSYWAKVADGIPQELASQNANGTVKFVNNEQSSFLVVDRYAETVDLRRARRIRDHIYFRRRRLAMAVSRRRARRKTKEGRFQPVRQPGATAAGRAADPPAAGAAAGFRSGRIVLRMAVPVGRVDYSDVAGDVELHGHLKAAAA